MKQVFSFIVLILITSMTVKAQEKNSFSKVFETDKTTTMIINLDDSSIIIEPSTDGKVHINNYYTFDGYSKKQLAAALKSKTIDAHLNESNNHITLTASKIVRNHTYYNYNGNGSLFIEGGLFGVKDKKNDTIIRKSKDSLMREIKGKTYKDLDFIGNRFKVKDKNGKVRNLRKGNTRILTNKFVVKIPPYLKLNINGKKSQIYFSEDIINELTVNLKEGGFTGKDLINNYNKFKIENANFKTENILGGDYTFNNVLGSKIGTLKQVNITSEFSKIEIGEIQEKVKITDFNSEYWFYNFAEDFERFDMFSEYSKIHHFTPETDYSMRAFGHNTINYIGDHKIRMQPTKNGEKYNMFDHNRKNEGIYAGHINLDIIHGIIYTYNDTFTPNKN